MARRQMERDGQRVVRRRQGRAHRAAHRGRRRLARGVQPGEHHDRGAGSRLAFGSLEPLEETLATTLVGELVYDRQLGGCTSLQLKGELRCSTASPLGEKDRLVRREQGSFIVSTKVGPAP